MANQYSFPTFAQFQEYIPQVCAEFLAGTGQPLGYDITVVAGGSALQAIVYCPYYEDSDVTGDGAMMETFLIEFTDANTVPAAAQAATANMSLAYAAYDDAREALGYTPPWNILPWNQQAAQQAAA